MFVFIRAQFSSILSTLIDWLTTILLVHCMLMYSYATAFGALAGGLCNFIVNRNWVFKKKHESSKKQAFRFFVTWIMSFFLNVGGTILCTEYFEWHYLASKLCVAMLVGISFNYFMQKYFVFKYGSTI